MKSTRKLVLMALLTALTCVTTMVITVPTPTTGGYINLGDCFVLISAWLLGPLYGGVVGGVGSALADLLLGYTHYVPGTLIIKGLMAVVAGLLFQAMRRWNKPYLSRILSAIPAELVMVAGYFGYAWLILGKGVSAALTSIPDNLFQGLIGIVASVALCAVIDLSRLSDNLVAKGVEHK